jgi:hypothetical protein
VKLLAWVVVALVAILVAVGFQLFFRYEYVTLPNVGILRVDRLTHRVCVAWPPDGTYRMSFCGRTRN